MIEDVVTKEKRRVRIALDFDGVLHSYKSGWTGPLPFDKPVKGAQDFCRTLIRRGYEIVIFTTRACPQLDRAAQVHVFVEYVEYDEETGSWHSRGNKGLTVGVFAIRAWLRHWGFPEEVVEAEITHKKEHAPVHRRSRLPIQRQLQRGA